MAQVESIEYLIRSVFDPKLMSQKVIDPFGGQVINQFN